MPEALPEEGCADFACKSVVVQCCLCCPPRYSHFQKLWHGIPGTAVLACVYMIARSSTLPRGLSVYRLDACAVHSDSSVVPCSLTAGICLMHVTAGPLSAQARQTADIVSSTTRVAMSTRLSTARLDGTLTAKRVRHSEETRPPMVECGETSQHGYGIDRCTMPAIFLA